ncbi:MAG: diguanylate cyclase [Deltaproteobacteria bacterium]|nr:diguanylate cyclase [Deltaproteobacteria bacterium]
MSYENPSSPIDDSPQRFLRLFHGMAILTSFVILTVACFIIISHSNNNMLLEAERTATKISESLVEEEMETIRFASQEGRRTLIVRPEDIKPLDLRLRMFLQPFDILKIKIYNSDRMIIFCTDEALIGKKDLANASLLSALEGKSISEIKQKKSVLDLYEEQRFDVDMVESYIPVIDTDKQVAGVFEIYIDISKAKQKFVNNIALSIGYLVAVLALVNGLHYLLIRKETEQLNNTQQQLKQMAITDPLTGMHNRRYVIKRLEDEFAKLSRQKEKIYGDGIGCIMIDVDDFKQVNDEYGHFVGDDVLCEVARRITIAVRQYDIPGRFGGEEFIVVLPNVSSAEVLPVAERIRTQINAEPFRVDGASKEIHVSMGIAWSDEKDGAIGMEQLLKISDDRLYVAKERGKNTIIGMDS